MDRKIDNNNYSKDNNSLENWLFISIILTKIKHQIPSVTKLN